MNNAQKVLNAACVCGRVRLQGFGRPISCLICYCDDCQAAGRAIESLPGAATALQPDAGTELIVYHRDRLRCVAGAELMQPLRLRESSPTRRMVATCCNTAMYVGFDDGKFWVDLWRSRVLGHAPPAEWRVCVRFRPESPMPADLPSFPGYPFRFVARLLLNRLTTGLRQQSHHWGHGRVPFNHE